jgi:excinuclease ABC subunit B
MKAFKLESDFKPSGDQPQAIKKIIENLSNNAPNQTLLGVTGSGKTFTIANVVQEVQRPTLVMAHNKTLAAQLYNEFKAFFPENAVSYFVSYYDYYQPEAYLPTSDTYIEKDASINDEIDKMRHAATHSLFERKDVLIVASVSCIYGLGSPEAYYGMLLFVEEGMTIDRDSALRKLIEIHYKRNDIDFQRGTFRVHGDVVEIFPVYERNEAIRIEFFGDEIDSICSFDPLTGRVVKKIERVAIYPASHHVTRKNDLERAEKTILDELRERIQYFRSQNLLIEAQRIEQRTMFDLEMIKEIGYCKGIENYSRHLTGRDSGHHPPTLLDYFPKDALVVIDESHATLPQLNGMYNGDRSRKDTLIRHGFRLPSAFDNRPLKFNEFEKQTSTVIYVSATPAAFEVEKSNGLVTELIVRPTGLVDPVIDIRPIEGQVDDVYKEILERSKKDERTLIMTLTKRFAEDLSEHLAEMGLRVKYLHSDITTLERMQIIRELRLGEFDGLIGINLLREGLDIPEVSLVAILDADKEGFLRSTTALIQTSGRAARNVEGKVIMYADKMTNAIKSTLAETERRRKIQQSYNGKHKITPTSIKKSVYDSMQADEDTSLISKVAEENENYLVKGDLKKAIARLEKEMREAARKLEFESAAEIRDKISKLKQKEVEWGVFT